MLILNLTAKSRRTPRKRQAEQFGSGSAAPYKSVSSGDWRSGRFGHFEGEALGGKACLQGERADEFSVRMSPYTARAFNAYRSSLESPYPREVQSLSPPGSQE